MKLPHFHHGKHERGKMPPPADDDGELQARTEQGEQDHPDEQHVHDEQEHPGNQAEQEVKDEH